MLRLNPASIISTALSARFFFTGLCLATTVLVWPSGQLTEFYPPHSPRSLLASNLGRARFSIARLTGDRRYSPPPLDLEFEPTRELLLASRRISERARSDPSAATLADAAFLQMANAWEAEAVTSLRRALSQEPDNPELWSDLAAAYLQRGLRYQDPVDLVEALDSAAKAVQIKPSLVEARFNLAVALEQLYLTSEAIVAWREFLILDSWSGWADEARDHLRSLEGIARPSLRQSIDFSLQNKDLSRLRKIVQHSPQAARVYAQDILLPRWGAHYRRRELAEAAHILTFAHVIAVTLERMGGDQTILDAIAAVQEKEGNERASALLARGYELYGIGAEHYENDQLFEAAGAFSEAAKLLEGEALGLWAEFWSAVLAFYDGRQEHALREIVMIGRRPEMIKCPALRGRVLWAEGLMRLIKSDLAASLPLYQASLDQFQRLGEQENVGTLEWLISENFRLLGESETAWKHRLRALKILKEAPDSPWRNNLLLTSAQVLLQEKRVLSAMYFQNEQMTGATRLNNSLTLAQAHLVRVRIHRNLNSLDEAHAALREAIYYMSKIQRGGFRDRIQAEVTVAEAELMITEGTRIVRSLLSSARLFYERSGRRSQAASTYLLQARASLVEGDAEAAEGDLSAAILLQRQAAESLRDALQMRSFSEQWQLLFDDLLQVQTNRGQIDSAFTSAEKSRNSSARHYSVEEIQALLPEDHVLVEYFVLPDKLLVWTVWRERWAFNQIYISSEDLEALVDAVVLELRHGSHENFQLVARKAYEILIRQVADLVPANARLVIVPDKILSRLPFGALVDQRSGRMLLEQWCISVSPSARNFLDSVEANHGERSNWRLLAIGNPSIDPVLFPALKPLPNAEREVSEIAELYPGSKIIIGADANYHVLLRELSRADVFHFAGHSLQDPRHPERSLLVLASLPGESVLPMVSASEIQALSLNHLQLVVLSACATAPGSRYRSQGVSGVAQTFLDGGARAVLASLWRVDDAAARTVLTLFHKNIIDGKDGASALRMSQLSCLSGRGEGLNPPADCVAFQLVGFVPPLESEDR